MTLAGVSAGAVIGGFRREKGDNMISKKTFFGILLIAICCIVMTVVLYMLFNRQSIVYVLILNGIGLIYSILLLRKSSIR